jgi:plasmid stabilization system protein ParE
MARVGDVRFHRDAIAEFEAAVDWYRENSEQAADDFVLEVDQAIARISENPLMWEEYLHGTRRYLLHRFPYLLVYLLYDNQVQVVAIAHRRRRPGYWKSRLKTR